MQSGRDSLKRRRMRLDTEAKLNICQQVTNAMTYLHNKNIVHGKLTSVNIYIEQNQRVKISLIDNDENGLIVCNNQLENQQTSTQTDTNQITQLNASFNRAALTYLSPELVRSIRLTTRTEAKVRNDSIEPDAKRKRCNETVVDIDSSRLTKAADIYSFGTLMFELFAEQYPFSNVDEHTCSKLALPSPTTTTQRSMTSTPDSGYRSNSQHERVQATPFPFAATPIRSSSLSGRVFFDDTMIASDNVAQLTQLSPRSSFSPRHPCLRPHHNYYCNKTSNTIEASAAELIYRIGSGQIEAKNLPNNNNNPQGHIPALVEKLIASCWSYKPEGRPEFKELSFV